jgi:hypothetical protein
VRGADEEQLAKAVAQYRQLSSAGWPQGLLLLPEREEIGAAETGLESGFCFTYTFICVESACNSFALRLTCPTPFLAFACMPCTSSLFQLAMPIPQTALCYAARHTVPRVTLI